MMLVAGYDAKQASKQLGRILSTPGRERLKAIIGTPIRINGCGPLTYATIGQQMHKLLMCVPPGRYTDEYLDECFPILSHSLSYNFCGFFVQAVALVGRQLGYLHLQVA